MYPTIHFTQYSLSSHDQAHSKTLSPRDFLSSRDICRVDIDLGREGVQMLKKRDQEKLEEMGEEHFLALILKDKTEDNQCRKELEKYCKSLEDAGLTSKQVDDKLGDYCEKGGKARKDKCTGLKNEIEKKCTEFKGKLEKALKEPFTEEKCEEYESHCHFLEGACINVLKEECSKLRNQCYGLKRDKVAEEVLLRALKGGLKQENKECKEKLEKECKRLNGFSKELMQLCLHSEGTCKHLKEEAKKKCDSLEAELKKALEKDAKNLKNETCHPLLEQCHFYGPNCEEKDGLECDELRTTCEEEHNIVYTPPEEPWFPIQPMPDIADKVGLEELYNEAAKLGLLIEGLHTSMEDLLLYLSQKNNDNGEFDQQKCQEAHKTRCNYLKELSGDLSYNCSKINEKCGELETELQERRDKLEKDIQIINLFDGNKGTGNPKTIPWHKLNSDIYGKRCPELQSDCFFLSRYNNKLKTACDNVQVMCYKRGLDVVAYETLENKMRGGFRDSEQDEFQKWLNQCQNKLTEVCNGVRNQSYHLLALCVEPKETCSSLSDEILDKTYELNHILSFTRDSPEKHDCLKLEPKCNRLKEENNQVLERPCNTLERNCRHLKELGEIERILLDEKKDLKDVDNCIPELNQQCNHWSRKVHKPFGLSCALEKDSCEKMTFNIYKYCDNLIKNINNSKIIDTLKEANKNVEKLRKDCPTWLPFCDQLSSTCPETNQENLNISLCQEIQKYCKPYQEKQTVEDAVLYEFRGNLGNITQCNNTLMIYCTQWGKSNNNSLVSLCNDTSDSSKNDKVKTELCQRLVNRVKKLCKKLPDKLKEEKEELTRRIEFYDKLKNKAENATKGTDVILTFSIENNSTDKTNNSSDKTNNSASHALVKRSERQPPITVLEASTFDLVAMVIGEYVDLKEKCRKLLLDCGFKECQGSQNTCKKINEKCKGLEPLKMRPPEVTTSTTTITQNVTVDSQGKTICTSGAPSISMNCTSIHTTDTWVTHTSTHTSTMTKTSTITSKVTIVSTKKCQPTQCTTDRTHPTHGSGEEAGDVKPSEGMRIHGWGAKGHTVKRYHHVTFLSPRDDILNKRWVDIDLGREGVQMLKKRDQGVLGGMEEEHFLALILKENTGKDNCKNKLKKYCESLKNAGLESKQVHKKLDVCKEEKANEDKCKELQEKIEGKCTKLEKELEAALRKRPIENENCEKYEPQCLFLEGACPNELTKKCSELRNRCYSIKRMNVALEVLVRALKGEFKEKNGQCEKKLKEHCVYLASMSKELLWRCLNVKETCEDLVNVTKKKCDSLRTN
ncbi:hypothetical protein PCANB_001948, partial [Pneumocystis canis]